MGAVMIFDRLLVAAVCGWLGVTGLLPATVGASKASDPRAVASQGQTKVNQQRVQG
jgi:hypothetical protein